MRVSLLQTDIVWGDVAANLRVAAEAVTSCPGSDLYVLPEMFTTGFATEPSGMAVREPDALEWMMNVADEADAAVAGSVAVQSDGRYYNRFYFVKPGRECVQYDKRHLFSYGGEDKHYTPGNKRVVTEWRGVRFLLQVCYDLRFPVWSRNHEDYDAAIYVASWPQSRRVVWDMLLRARAVENQCYVLGVNRVGDDPQCHYNGGTLAVDAYGRVQAQCSDEMPDAVSVDLDMSSLLAFREKFPVLKDRD